MPIRRIYQIIHQMKIVRIKMRETVFSEGDPSNFLYLIKEGEIEL